MNHEDNISQNNLHVSYFENKKPCCSEWASLIFIPHKQTELKSQSKASITARQELQWEIFSGVFSLQANLSD